jgi:probable phosphoglycerate mutase
MTVEMKRGYYLLNTDGGMASDGHPLAGQSPGIAAIGALLRTRRLAVVAELAKTIGPATHNEAEYHGLIAGLKLAHHHGVERLRVYMDSELVVEQMNGFADVKHARLKDLHDVAQSMAADFRSIRFSWVPRELNAEADKLARQAFAA